jgi:hypothetical protein
MNRIEGSCPVCGGTATERNLRGSRIPYRDEASLEITVDVLLPHCEVCDEEWLDADLTARMSRGLEASYREHRRRQVAEMVDDLVHSVGLEQKDIEAIMGLSAGYISKAKRGEKDLTPATYRLLVLLRMMPEDVLESLQRIDSRLQPLAERVADRLHMAY